MNESWQQIPMFPIYACEAGEFLTLREAALALGTVTANPTHTLVRRPGDGPEDVRAKHALYEAGSAEIAAGRHSRSTLLKEVRAVMRTPPPEIQALYAKPTGRDRTWRPADAADAAVEALSAHVEACWDPSARHVVPFSSGYDSRLVAALLRRLADTHGMAWIGEICFYTFKPEIAYARRVWQALDWPAGTFFPIDPGAAGTDYYAEVLDLRTNGENLSEADRFWPGQLLAQLRLQAAGWLEPPVQGVSGVFADETNKWNRLEWSDVGWFTACWLMDSPGVLPGVPECRFILPFVSLGWMRLLTEHYMPLAIDQFKLLLLERLRPELADVEVFPNFRFEARKVRERNLATLQARGGAAERGHLDQQWLSEGTAARMEGDYRKSWYARTFGPAELGFEKMRAFVHASEAITHYLKAAIYEGLREAGVEVATP